MKVENIFILLLLFQQTNKTITTVLNTNQKRPLIMPIRINATQPRSEGNSTSTRTTERRRFNRNSLIKDVATSTVVVITLLLNSATAYRLTLLRHRGQVHQ